MTTQDFVKIFFKIIGVSGIFILIFSFTMSLSPFFDADGSEMNISSSFYFVITLILIALNFAFLLPMLVIVVNSMYYFEKGTITKEANFKKIKTCFYNNNDIYSSSYSFLC